MIGAPFLAAARRAGGAGQAWRTAGGEGGEGHDPDPPLFGTFSTGPVNYYSL